LFPEKLDDFHNQQYQRYHLLKLLGDQVNTIRLEGKTFSAAGDSDRHFGKHALSQHIDKNADRFDFTGFAPILKRISDAIQAHMARYVAEEPALGHEPAR